MRNTQVIIAISVSFVLLFVVAYIDFITTADLVLGVFYFIPISITAWYSGRNSALILSVIGAIIWYFADEMTGRPYLLHDYVYWNSVLRWLSFAIIAWAVSQIKSMLDKEMQLKNNLAQVLDNIKQYANAAKKVAEGDLSVKLPVIEKDGKDHLDATFNFMVQRLAEQKNLENKLFRLERQAIMAETASFLAHEIRNPLNLIMLTAHHLGTQFTPKEVDRQHKFKEMIASLKAEVEQLSSVVSNFMAIGKPYELTRSQCTLFDLTNQILVMIKQQLTSKRITVECSGNMAMNLNVDQEQMRLVFLNLFVNAIAVVPENGKIALHVVHDRNNNKAIISMEDNGPGINQDDLDKIFEPYYTRKQGGTGLGLALVNRLLNDHNGSIKAENRPAGGARFEITLPLEE